MAGFSSIKMNIEYLNYQQCHYPFLSLMVLSKYSYVEQLIRSLQEFLITGFV